MTRKPKARGRSPRNPHAAPRKRTSGRPLARGIVRRALTDPAIFDAIVKEADATSPEARDRVRAARRLLLAAREPRPWTASAERRLAAYRRTWRDVRRHLPSADWRPMSLLLAWAKVPAENGR